MKKQNTECGICHAPIKMDDTVVLNPKSGSVTHLECTGKAYEIHLSTFSVFLDSATFLRWIEFKLELGKELHARWSKEMEEYYMRGIYSISAPEYENVDLDAAYLAFIKYNKEQANIEYFESVHNG